MGTWLPGVWFCVQRLEETTSKTSDIKQGIVFIEIKIQALWNKNN
jgi:hypothetical protein